MKWTYGVTTVCARRKDLLPRTLASLKGAGFDLPRLFVDGDRDALSWEREFCLPVTARYPVIKTPGNWILGLYELFIREPTSDRFAMFQDDFVTYPNLREYLEKTPYPDKGYLNLYTFADNEELRFDENGKERKGWFESNQKGRGAVALVFDRVAIMALLIADHLAWRPLDCHLAWKKVDGAIVDSMRKAGFKEYVHNPSLVMHTGKYSVMGNKPHQSSTLFKGEDFDARRLLDE